MSWMSRQCEFHALCAVRLLTTFKGKQASKYVCNYTEQIVVQHSYPEIGLILIWVI